jgi:hypothetical protein
VRSIADGYSVRVETVDDRYAEAYGDTRIAAGVASGFGGIAFIVAMVGLYRVDDRPSDGEPGRVVDWRSARRYLHFRQPAGRSSVAIPRRVASMLALTVGLAACGSDPVAPTAPTPAPAPVVVPPGLSPVLTGMLNGLQAHITESIAYNRDLLPRNPQSTAQLQAKIAMLENPSLAAEIIQGQRWVEGQAGSLGGPPIAIATVFPLEFMRADAAQVIGTLESSVPPLETFFAIAFPAPSIRVWYGFALGNRGGGGVIHTEDRTTYEGRTGPNRLPYDAILGHELAHSYISNEMLTQFLELYLYNVIRTGSIDPAVWVFTRDWVPDQSSNAGLAAVLDVYQLLGHDAMARAYRAVYPLRPPYGQPLSPAVIQAFVDQAPADARDLVAAKLATIVF